ncbi:MAG: hypothetical protein GX579_06790 [Chloroflexi bacterium]|jgi:mono/diheme cytochrome c family protein|nr:hypothetical protein [Chloroflexota bacterium]
MSSSPFLAAGARLRLSPAGLALAVLALLWLSAPRVGAAQDGATPPEQPDGEAGLALFAERCANCHGPLGAGDGELTGNLPVQPAALNDAAFARQQVPVAIFEAITNGIAASGMPPFGPASSNPLGEADRWRLVAAVLSLGVPPETLAEGETVYAASCAQCHGNGGREAFDMTAQDYWTGRSDEEVFAALRDTEAIPEHEAYALDDDELWAVVAYARTFSYDYANPLAAFEPIESVNVTGIVRNETTGELLAEGTPVVLNTFTGDFAPSETLTTTLDATGQYGFNLSMVPPDLIYVVSVNYDGLNYGSDFGRAERDEPVLDLPVTVYDRTSDATGVRIGQLHIILEFGEGTVTVNELYQFSQDGNAVYVGKSGDLAGGTVEIGLPEGASTPSFSRTFGSVDSFFPAENMVQTVRGWADSVPVRPGEATLSLLAGYTLPYDGEATIAHPVYYDVTRANVVIAATGVTLSGEDGWTEEPGGAMGGTFASYTLTGIPAGDTLSFTLEGDAEPVVMPGSGGSTAATGPIVRDRTTELVIGAGALLLVLAVSLVFVRNWRQSKSAGVAYAEEAELLDRDALLDEIAALDDAYEAGEIDEATYLREREALKEALLAVWE